MAETGKMGRWPKPFVLLPLLLTAVFMVPLGAEAVSGTEPEIFLSSPQVHQGDLVLLRVKVAAGDGPQVSWMGKDVPLVACGKGVFCGYLGVDLKSASKTLPLKVAAAPSGWKRTVDVRIQSKDYGVRRLTLPREKVELDERTLERVQRESAALKGALDVSSQEPLWRGSFLRPVEGELSGSFGRGNIINGEIRSPHSGVDLKAELGCPVEAMNHGRVTLVADHFFSGLSVVVDHGGGIQSMYFHLQKILVQEGQSVRKGDVIGRVGSTGRSTGPHLHLGIRVNGARVDPLRLIELSKGME
jgi:murein DD-endopeptidase MepM/ murein hydrolase activator NlpD